MSCGSPAASQAAAENKMHTPVSAAVSAAAADREEAVEKPGRDACALLVPEAKEAEEEEAAAAEEAEAAVGSAETVGVER